MNLRIIKEGFLTFCKGICMGAADIVPGVSGGTIAFILGIYERLLAAIAKLPTALKNIFKYKQIAPLKHLDWRLFIPLGLGIVTAFLSLSTIMTYLLEFHVGLTYAFFTGLITASAIILVGHTKTKSVRFVVYAFIAAIIAYLVTGLTSSALPNTLPIIFFSGVIAISAMLLPGISGSYLLVVLGQYEFIINAIHQRDFLIILVFGVGAIIGLLSVAKILHNLFKKYHDLMLFVLTGVMLGAMRVPINHIQNAGSSIVSVSLVIVAGALLVFLVQHIRRQKQI